MRRLIRRSSYRQAERAFVAEGLKVVSVALDSGAPVESLLVVAGASDAPEVEAIERKALDRGARVFYVSSEVMERTADTVTPQPVLAVIASAGTGLDDLLSALDRAAADQLLLVCADVRDPGNLGAVIRSAAASGCSGVVCAAGTVDPFSPKAVRASAGALFQVPVVRAAGLEGLVGVLGEGGFRLVGTAARGGDDYAGVDWSGKVALLLGNEANGLPAEVLARLGACVTIPMEASSESLNVAMTATVICFEVARRRRFLDAGRLP